MKTRINPKNGDLLSILGYGCMRFPTINGKINEPLAKEHIMYAINNGVNYFDTAYIYHNGKSEGFIGKVFEEESLRSKVKIATKLPPFLVRNKGDIEKIFLKQLSRLRTNYIDYYLIHMLSDINSFNRLCSFGLLEWIAEKKKSGQILQIGFSFHGGREQFKEILNAYNWDFTQIQYNYLDINNQAGKSGLELAYSLGIPVIIMEPLRGGQLVNSLPKQLEKMWDDTGSSAAANALNFIWNHKEVTLLLSGMSDFSQLKENIELASIAEPGMLSEENLLLFEKARQILNENTKVPCTGCSYCMPCPFNVDIPTCFSCYNEVYTLKSNKFRYLQATGALSKNPANASKCTGCGKCEKHCPQSIAIREKLKEVSKTMEGPLFKIITFIAKRFM